MSAALLHYCHRGRFHVGTLGQIAFNESIQLDHRGRGPRIHQPSAGQPIMESVANLAQPYSRAAGYGLIAYPTAQQVLDMPADAFSGSLVALAQPDCFAAPVAGHKQDTLPAVWIVADACH
ncbi:MAG TPA: hypothetical protein PLM77_11120 [Phycisphaerae bacterium]|nr:hypothetical protein [Phycisphaerae bacterium]HQE43738.1 hypothetical protein [Phycisphaerae bacterium]